ncbi:MAG: thioredoxin family protein [Planctomycetales bacterium]
MQNPCRATILALFLAFVAAETDSFGLAAATKAKFNQVLDLGEGAPEWSDLPGTDGMRHSLTDFQDSKVVVLVFTCNHCPMAKLYEQRLLKFAKDYTEKQVQVVAVSVSRHPADALEKLQVRARDRGYPFPYLCDASQQIGRRYGATGTPHFFVLDAERKIAYMGAFDDQHDEAKVEKRFLIDAVEAVLRGERPPVRETLQRGCAIEYEE